MSVSGEGQSVVLYRLRQWFDTGEPKVESFNSNLPESLETEISQEGVFKDDFKRCIHHISTHSKHELRLLAQAIVAIIAAPLLILAAFYEWVTGKGLNTSLIIISLAPLCMLRGCYIIAKTVYKILNITIIGVGFLAWHSGERAVRVISGASSSVLSNAQKIRDIVYNSLGRTLLAGATVLFIPIITIQLIALPIILGSIYGTLNNQFTVRECPEYYTMGHYYDGTDLKGHAIKTNNLFIKPFITGCYATTMVTQIAGLVLSALGTIPYTTAVLTVPFAAMMIAGVSIIALIAAHVFSSMKKNSIQKKLEDYAVLTGILWNETNMNKTWDELKLTRNWHIVKKGISLWFNAQEFARFNKNVKELTNELRTEISQPNTPIKYFASWSANDTRNGVGYISAGIGTIAISVSTIFLRIFVL